MIKVLHKVAELRKIGIFPRFEVMRETMAGMAGGSLDGLCDTIDYRDEA